MNCSICNGQLEKGTIEIRSKFEDFIWFGLSNQRLFTEGKDGKRKEISNTGRKNFVLKCHQCEAIVIPDMDYVLPLLEGLCQRCGTKDEFGKPYCQECGQHVSL